MVEISRRERNRKGREERERGERGREWEGERRRERGREDEREGGRERERETRKERQRGWISLLYRELNESFPYLLLQHPPIVATSELVSPYFIQIIFYY